MAVLTAAFLDTSVLVAGLIEIGEASEYPQWVMAAIAGGQVRRAVTAWHCCLEFYSVTTRLPEEFRLLPEEALRLVQEEIVARLEVRQLSDRDRENFLRVLEQERVIGGRVYDAHIAQVARISGAKAIVTDNRRHVLSLARHGIRVLGAEEFTKAAGLGR